MSNNNNMSIVCMYALRCTVLRMKMANVNAAIRYNKELARQNFVRENGKLNCVTVCLDFYYMICTAACMPPVKAAIGQRQ